MEKFAFLKEGLPEREKGKERNNFSREIKVIETEKVR